MSDCYCEKRIKGIWTVWNKGKKLIKWERMTSERNMKKTMPQASVYILGRILTWGGFYLEQMGTFSERRGRDWLRTTQNSNSCVSGLGIRISEFDPQIHPTRGKSLIPLESVFTLGMINILSMKGKSRYAKTRGSNQSRNLNTYGKWQGCIVIITVFHIILYYLWSTSR